MIKILKYCLLFLFFISGCAVIESPKGGEKDKTPPKILEIEPKGGINYKSKTVTFEFSQYMDKNKVIENISISPTTELKFDWSGKSLEVEFVKDLDSNTTYSLNLGTDYTDYLQNKPEEALSYIFSTGNTIDSGSIEGNLFSKETQGVYIFAYKKTNLFISIQ